MISVFNSAQGTDKILITLIILTESMVDDGDMWYMISGWQFLFVKLGHVSK